VHEIVNGKIFFQRIVDAVEAALIESGEIEGGFSKGFAGNGAGVDAASTHVLSTFDDSHAFAEVSRLGAALFAGRAAAEDDQVESIARSHEFLRQFLELDLHQASGRIVGEVGGRRRSFLPVRIGRVPGGKNRWRIECI